MQHQWMQKKDVANFTGYFHDTGVGDLCGVRGERLPECSAFVGGVGWVVEGAHPGCATLGVVVLHDISRSGEADVIEVEIPCIWRFP